MLLAVRPCLGAHEVEGRSLRAGFVKAPRAVDIHHALRSMLLAVRRLVPLQIEVWPLFAGVM